MAATDVLSTDAAQDDLSDEQIEALLARATARLQQHAKEQQVTTQKDGWNFKFPKLDAGNLESPYIRTKGEVASVDAKRLLDDKDRKQANGIRKVEDPVAAKKALSEVSAIRTSVYRWHYMRKIFPTISRAESGHRYGQPFRIMRAFIFIVTLTLHDLLQSIFPSILLEHRS